MYSEKCEQSTAVSRLYAYKRDVLKAEALWFTNVLVEWEISTYTEFITNYRIPIVTVGSLLCKKNRRIEIVLQLFTQYVYYCQCHATLFSSVLKSFEHINLR